MCGASHCVRVLLIVDTGLSGGVCSWRLRDSFSLQSSHLPIVNRCRFRRSMTDHSWSLVPALFLLLLGVSRLGGLAAASVVGLIRTLWGPSQSLVALQI